MHKIHRSICESKCETVLIGQHSHPTAVIFDRLCSKGPLVNITFSLPDHRAVVHLRKKNLQMLGPWAVEGCAREGLGNEILTSAILL